MEQALASKQLRETAIVAEVKWELKQGEEVILCCSEHIETGSAIASPS